MIKTKTWMILLSLIFIFSSALSLYFTHGGSLNSVIEIQKDGNVIETIDLSRVQKEYSFVLADEDGSYNEITVRPNEICISDADCKDRYCVRQGWISKGNLPIVCLPHKLVIRFISGTEIDGVSR